MPQMGIEPTTSHLFVTKLLDSYCNKITRKIPGKNKSGNAPTVVARSLGTKLGKLIAKCTDDIEFILSEFIIYSCISNKRKWFIRNPSRFNFGLFV